MWPRFTAWVVVAGVCTAGHVRAADPDKAGPPDAQTIEALKRGGYVIYMRHVATDTGRPDRVPAVDFGDCATQRPLSERGRRQAGRLGEALRRLAIPIGEVRVSPYCRTKETAALVFGGSYTVDANLASTSNLADADKAPKLQALRRSLGEAVPAGANRVLVSHNAPLMDAIGVYPRPEGVMIVFRPDGRGGFARFATIVPDDWPRLAALRR